MASRRVDSHDHNVEKPDQLPGVAAAMHLRNSPPFQPGEQRPSQQSLPSFSELMQNVRNHEPSPPSTPARTNGSVEDSPRSGAMRFEEMNWHERRARADSSLLVPENLRRPSALDPSATSSHTTPYGAPDGSVSAQMMAPSSQRPSLPMPAERSSYTSNVHARHQSPPASMHQIHYHQTPTQHFTTAAAYPPTTPRNAEEHTASFYHYSMSRQPPPPHGPSYDRPPPPAYYPQSSYPMAAHPHQHHPGYAVDPYHHPPPSSFTFQATLGVDQGNFNRKRRGNLPKEATTMLKDWFGDHKESPYPSEEEKVQLCNRTGLTMNQVSNWFINARRRAPGKEEREKRASPGKA